MSKDVILVEVLAHVFELIKVSKLSFLIVHNDFLLFLDSLNDLLHLVLEVDVHTLNIISLGFSGQKLDESFLFFFHVDWLSIFR